MPEPREYDVPFYEREQDASLASARVFAPYLCELLHPQSVVDVGCGVGGWLLAFKEQGVETIRGYDGDWVKPEMLRIPRECFSPHDISQPIANDRRYDLAINLEAAEHLPPERAGVLIDSLARLAPVILFSAAIPHQEGRNHVNEQWPDYWIELFRQRSYRALDCLRARLWNHPDVRWWYKQNAMLMVHEDRLRDDATLQELAKSCPEPLPLVHPDLFEEKWGKLVNARSKQRPPATVRSGLRELRRGMKNLLRRASGKEPR
jgi:SAM-dependent methyltransferase